MNHKKPNISREQLSTLLHLRLAAEAEELRASFHCSGNIRYCVVDNVFPQHIAEQLYASFPDGNDSSPLNFKDTIREKKYSSNQVHELPSALTEAVLSFESAKVVELFRRITGFESIITDSDMYAGGVSEMRESHFVMPHIDNSHDFHRENYRAINTLFYLAKDWNHSSGGNLELWPDGLAGEKIEIVSKFNRLIIMETPPHSWHAVNTVKSAAPRRCVFYTYFRPEPLSEEPYFQITSMRALPENKVLDKVLTLDVKLRMALRKIFPKGIKGSAVIWDRKEHD